MLTGLTYHEARARVPASLDALDTGFGFDDGLDDGDRDGVRDDLDDEFDAGGR